MADRQPEKKETEANEDNWIPVVTPDCRRNNKDQRQRSNPRDYKAHFKWNNPYSLLGQTDQPIKRATPNKTEDTRTETKSQNENRRRRRLKMTDDDEKTYTGTAKVLKEEM